jgi:hypothetical protein
MFYVQETVQFATFASETFAKGCGVWFAIYGTMRQKVIVAEKPVEQPP